MTSTTRWSARSGSSRARARWPHASHRRVRRDRLSRRSDRHAGAADRRARRPTWAPTSWAASCDPSSSASVRGKASGSASVPRTLDPAFGDARFAWMADPLLDVQVDVAPRGRGRPHRRRRACELSSPRCSAPSGITLERLLVATTETGRSPRRSNPPTPAWCRRSVRDARGSARSGRTARHRCHRARTR